MNSGVKPIICLISWIAWLSYSALCALGQAISPPPVAQPAPETAASAPAELPEFEIASIKLADPRRAIAGTMVYPGGRVFAGGSLRILVMLALDMQMYQVKGGPDWADTQSFAIEAKPPESSPSSKLNPPYPKEPLSDEQRQMLLALLIDRFQLKFHRESREGRIYLLEREGRELKLETPKDANAFPWFGGIEGGAVYRPTGIAGQNISMPLLATRLSSYFECPVIDKTGITGSFDFSLKSGEVDPAVSFTRDDVVSSILTGLQGVGLELKPAKGPVDTAVIESAQQPSPN